MNKADLRKNIRARLLGILPVARREMSLVVCARIAAHPRFRDAGNMLLFAPQAIEPDVELLWDFPEMSAKRIAYPRVDGDALRLHSVENPTELVAGRWGLREPPSSAPIVRDCEVDLAIVPGVAFSLEMQRLGRGGGYYDRLLARMPDAYKIGVCFDFQVFGHLPPEPHDVPMNELIAAEVDLASAPDKRFPRLPE